MGRFEIVLGRLKLWIVVGRCGIVVGLCGSLWVVPGFSSYGEHAALSVS